jgi:GNAT superfamily N-acetyltransferase
MVRVAVLDGRPVACTVILPRQVIIRGRPVQGAAVTLVGCLPEHQKKGFGGATVESALAFMGQNGMGIGVLYGHPTYYPRFGFAPVIARMATTIPVGDCLSSATALRPAIQKDYAWMLDLFKQQFAYPCSPQRTSEPWVWQPRNPAALRVMAMSDESGYAFVHGSAIQSSTSPEEKILYVAEAACKEKSAAALMEGLAGMAKDAGASTVRFALPPDHPISRFAFALGGEQIRRPATAGMAAVTQWSAVLPDGYSVSEGALRIEGKPLLYAGRLLLTQLACGYYDIDDLLLLSSTGRDVQPDVSLEVGDLKRLRLEFPKSFPKWSEEPYWS